MGQKEKEEAAAPSYEVLEEGESFQLKVNPEYEVLWTPLSDEVYDKLFKRIEVERQHDLIIVNEKFEILDGHNRHSINHRLKRPDKYVRYDFHGDKLAEKEFVRDANLHRRHIDTDADRVILMEKWAPIYEERAKRNQSLAGKLYGKGKEKNNDSFCPFGQKLFPSTNTRKQAAEAVGLSSTQAYRGVVIRKEDPERFEKMRANKETIGAVYEEYSKKKDKEDKEQKKQKLREVAAAKIEIPNLDLRLGDIRVIGKEIPDNSIPLIFTDPPYNKQSIPLYKDLGALADRVLMPGGALVAMVGQYFMHQFMDNIEAGGPNLGWGWPLTMVMAGNHQAAHPKKIFIMCKHLLYYVKGGKLRDGIVDYMPDLIYSKQPEKLLHPEGWEQSEVEAAHCIRYLTVENETVLDPFLGSGIFGVAALKLNRKFIGIEIDPNILDDAKCNINSKLQNKEEAAK